MRITRLHARAFGPFRDRLFTFARGMNVIYGPNEAGKSSLHAATYAGLCGTRRGRGGKRGPDRDFEERHRPWSGESWSVEIDLELEDGRRIQILQDLAGQVDSRALDLDTGRDLTAELLHEGMPDGSRLLGLTRDILPETICIRQGDVLRVLSHAGALQEQLQRAAAAGGAGEPAEAAIHRIRDFQRERVGLLKAGAKRPHQAATETLARSRSRREQARAAHEAYLATVERRNQAEVDAGEAEGRLAAIEQAVARRRAAQQRQRVDRAQRLAATLPTDPPPEMTKQLQQLAATRAALAAFDARPPVPAPTVGRGVSEIEQELSKLPEPPATDRPPDPAPTKALLSKRPAMPLRLPVGLVAIVAGLALALLTSGFPRVAGLVAIAVGVALLAIGLKQRTPGRQEPDDASLRELREEFRAGRREQLKAELASRRAMEQATEQARGQCAEAEERIRGAARTTGINGTTLEETVLALRELAGHAAREIEQAAREREDWATLQELLDGRSLEELESELLQLEQRLPNGAEAGESASETTDLEQLLVETRRRRDEARRDLDNLNGQVEVIERELPDVAAAEEAHERAREERARVASLKETLECTLGFLDRARDRVQRDVAPVLRSSVEDHLARITDGRYREAMVDPADLTVQVRAGGGSWTAASKLSHGTQEQIYLLLRLGLATHLVTTGEPAPLLLDDPTVQCDAERTVALLELLHSVSRERQIILFSQELEVLQWSRRQLTGDDDRVVELERIPA